MAKTTEQLIQIKGEGSPVLLPVYAGETIYKGTLAVIGGTGYLYNLTSTTAKHARIVALVADGSANTGGPAATTSSGSVSSSLEIGSVADTDKTVRLCYTKATVKLTFTAIAQSDVGKTVFATDNYTVDESQALGVKIGTLVSYISATEGWVELNTFYQADGAIFFKGNLTAATSTAVAGAFSWTNSTGETILVEELFVDITTGSTGAAVIDFGVGTSTASKDTLIDGCVCSLARVRCIAVDGGTNGRPTKATNGQLITGTASATLASMVGTVGIKYRLWE